MRKQTALKMIFIISILGMAFSGYLSYVELFKGACALGTCPSVVAIPACVYGFVMYLIVAVISWLGMKGK